MRACQFDAGTKARRVICELESDSRGMFERCFVIFFKLGQRKRTQVDSALDESDIVRIRRISYKREIMCEAISENRIHPTDRFDLEIKIGFLVPSSAPTWKRRNVRFIVPFEIEDKRRESKNNRARSDDSMCGDVENDKDKVATYFCFSDVQIAVIALASCVAAAPAEDVIPIVSQSQEGPNPDGSYKWSYESGNGIKAQEEGHVENAGQENEAMNAQGSFSYPSDDGQQISLTYVANEEGFQPQGAHLPTTPEIPPLIQKALEWIAAHPSKEDQNQV